MGCACNATASPFNASSTLTGKQILENQGYRHILAGKQFISANDFRNGDLLAVFRYTWCVDKDAFKKAFSKVGVEINEDELPLLVQLAKTGQDKEGMVTDNKGNKIRFSVMETFNSIVVSKDKIANSNCTVQFI